MPALADGRREVRVDGGARAEKVWPLTQPLDGSMSIRQPPAWRQLDPGAWVPPVWPPAAGLQQALATAELQCDRPWEMLDPGARRHRTAWVRPRSLHPTSFEPQRPTRWDEGLTVPGPTIRTSRPSGRLDRVLNDHLSSSCLKATLRIIPEISILCALRYSKT